MLRKVAFAISFFSSSVAFSAGITIDVDLDISIDPIKYVDYDDSLNADLTNSKLSSLNLVASEYSDSYIPLVVENDDLSLTFLYRDGNLLKNVNKTQTGTRTWEYYPEISYDFDRAYLIGNQPFIIDLDADTILQWDASLETWKDLSLSLPLPTGEYDREAFVYSNQLYFSVESSGIWQLGLTPKNVSSTRIKDANLAGTLHGLAELHAGNEKVYVDWLSRSFPDSDFSGILQYGQINAFAVDSSSTGTLYQFVVNDGLILLWDDVDNTKDTPLTLPIGLKQFKGCHWTSQNLLCAFISDENSLVFYEVADGQLNIDSEYFTSDLTQSGLDISAIYAAGKSRFISTRLGTISRLYELNSADVLLLEEFAYQNGLGYANLRMSRSSDQFYWIEANMDKVFVYNAKVSGELNFERIIADPDDSEELENASISNNDVPTDNNGDTSEGIGSLGLMAMTILLLLIRRKDVLR